MINSIDLYRSVKPNELLTKFKFNSSTTTITLEQLFQHIPPYRLGSFKLDTENKEVDLIYEISLMKTIPGSVHPKICGVKRLGDGGLSCFTKDGYLAEVEPLPPVGHESLHSDCWYYLGAAEIAENETLCQYLEEESDSRNFQYNGQNAIVFLSYQLPAGVRLPKGYETHFDNNPVERWTIRRSDFNQFSACFCQIGDGLNYAMIPELVEMGWKFQGLKLHTAAEPADYNDSYDKDTWTLAAIMHAYFSCLSSEELVNDAVMLLAVLSAGGYTRESCSSPVIAKVLLRVLDDLVMCCDELELATISKFPVAAEQSYHEHIWTCVIDLKDCQSEGNHIFWDVLVLNVSQATTEFESLPQEPLTLTADRFRAFYWQLNIGGKECPSNNILNALTCKYTLYYLQEVANESLEVMKKVRDTQVSKAPLDVSSASEENEAIKSFASVNTTCIKRVSSHGRDPRTKWVCEVCQNGCGIGQFWYTLCKCGHKFHVPCIGQWLFKEEDGVNSCPLCQTCGAMSIISSK